MIIAGKRMIESRWKEVESKKLDNGSHKNIKNKYPKHAVAENSVRVARDFLIAHGFIVSNANNSSANGPDLVAIKDGFGCKVEVKTATSDRGTWRIGKVTRQDDDYILIVFPGGAVHVDAMVTHLKQCNKDGTRFVTILGRIYE